MSDGIRQAKNGDHRQHQSPACRRFKRNHRWVACFETAINEDFVKQLATRKPLRAVFRDAGFACDGVKINVEQIFKLISSTTEIKTI